VQWLELWCGVGGVDVVGAKEHESACGQATAERSKTQLMIVILLPVDDHTVDINASVKHRQLTAGPQLPQPNTAV